MNTISCHSTSATADNVNLCHFVEYIIDAGFLSAEHRMCVSTKSLDAFVSSFVPLLSESISAMLYPVEVRVNKESALDVDIPQMLYRMWCSFEESSLAAVAANIVAGEFDANDYLVPFNNGMALRSFAEDHHQRSAAARWLPRVLNRCVRRLLRLSFTKLAAPRAESSDTCSVSIRKSRWNSNASDETLSLAARARRLSSDGELLSVPANIHGDSSAGTCQVEDVAPEGMNFANRDVALSHSGVETSRQQEIVIANSFSWAAPADDLQPSIGMRPTCVEGRRQEAMSAAIPASTTTFRLKPEGPFSAALWRVPDWVVNGEPLEPRQQHGWRR
jgi:hypothetical protein